MIMTKNMKSFKLLKFLLVSFSLVFASCSGSVLSQKYSTEGLKNFAATITSQELREYVEYLASDDLEGRCAGKKGETKAQEYIVSHFKEIGLKPVGDKDENGANTFYQKIGKGTMRNCVGLLEGADEELKKEIIIIGAHHDGQGMENDPIRHNPGGCPEDKIWNSADDNASGVSVVLACARAFAKSKIKTKRSILFMTFTGEELGFFGSRYYVKNPLFPLKNHIAMLNFDMVGRSTKRSITVGCTGAFEDSDIIENLFKDMGKKMGFQIKSNRAGWGSADHLSFLTKKIPAVHFCTGLHKDYHARTDTADKLNYGAMRDLAMSVFLILNEMANAKYLPKYNNNYDLERIIHPKLRKLFEEEKSPEEKKSSDKEWEKIPRGLKKKIFIKRAA